ncbi:MAG: shikimate kinase AroL [Desulfobacter sp.]
MPCDPHSPARPIFLIGYRCTGKTTTGRLLAQKLARPFVDTDQTLETDEGITIARMVDTFGWAHFRQAETRTLLALDLGQGPVVATGGGIILAEENRRFLQEQGIAVWLQADAQTIMARLTADAASADSRPDLTRQSLEDETRQMLALRNPLYETLARITINTAAHSPEAAADLIKRRLDHERL